MSLQAATEVRRRLLAGGFHVLPTVGKIPAPKRWQSLHAGETDISAWPKRFPDAINTGVLCGAVSVIDLDVYNATMADQVEAMVRNVAGAGLVRYGKRPKRALFFRAITPFKKISTQAFVGPDGQACRVEVLGAGQQCVVDGRHPETGENYVWPNGELTSLAELPEISEAKAKVIISTAESMMVAAGWPAEKPKTEAPIAPPIAPSLDVDSIYGRGEGREQSYAASALAGMVVELSAMLPNSGRNDRLNALAFRAGTMAARHWIDPADIKAQLLQAATANGLVAEDGRAAVIATIQSGLGDGLKFPHLDLDEPATKPAIEPDKTAPIRFILSREEAVTWSSDSDYLIHGVLPKVGLALIYGQAKSGKSFWTHDLVMHIARGIDYRGHDVVAGCVVYIAAEGGAGFRKRIEAYRRKHAVKDADFYFVRGPARFGDRRAGYNLGHQAAIRREAAGLHRSGYSKPNAGRQRK